MKKFTFSLEKVLRLRAWNEEEARLELGRAVGERTSLEQALVELAQKQAAAGGCVTSGDVGRNLQVYQNYITRLEAEKESLLVKITEAELKVNAAREAWIESKSALKTIENLKEKQFKEYRKDVFKQEEKELDGIFRPAKKELLCEQ